jgi:hypothetical protein
MKASLCSFSAKLFVVFILLIPSAFAKIHLKISSTAQVKESFEKWTAEKSFEQLNSYKSAYANRATVDLILQLQALKAGGLDFDFELNVAPNNARARLEVVQANADLTAETIWDSQIETDKGALFRTESIIREGEIEKGVYALPSNQEIMKVKSLSDLQQFVGVAVNSWEIDVRTLRQLKLKGLELPSTNESVYAMIAKGRADFAMLELSSEPDMGVEFNGVRLIPVPGVLIPLVGGSRSWIVSRNSPNAQAIFNALTQGVKLMREDGRITRAYKESGFFNQRTTDWQRLR